MWRAEHPASHRGVDLSGPQAGADRAATRPPCPNRALGAMGASPFRCPGRFSPRPTGPRSRRGTPTRQRANQALRSAATHKPLVAHRVAELRAPALVLAEVGAAQRVAALGLLRRDLLVPLAVMKDTHGYPRSGYHYRVCAGVNASGDYSGLLMRPPAASAQRRSKLPNSRTS